MILSRLRVVWTVFCLHLKQVTVNGFFIFTVIVQPLIMALLATFMLRDTEGFQAIYVIVGSAMAGLWSGTLYFSSFNVNNERWGGTLEEIVGSPTHLATVIVSKTLANTAMSLSSILFSYPLAALLFGYRLTIVHPFLFAVSLLLTVLALISLGLVIAPIMSLNVGAILWVNALEFPMYILGDFFFPIALLPAWTTPLSYVLSPYWAARALHATSSGGVPLNDVFTSWGLLIAFSVAYWFISAWLFRVLLRRAKEEATLGLQ
ncbi:MAG: ABC transporter permease [Chloroflexota bacterium]|nr:ABC transporter permease [Chloroflexota bacterium]